ncbi:MAG: DNA polymerase I [Betaproteobacteria bacterium]|nr:DNA polymerase I [Betaproteobacteria bacterium]
MKTLLLVDGSSYLYRAFHALPDLRNRKNEPTGAVYGVLNMLRRLRKEYAADYSACVFDAKGKTFRDELYPEYKAHRPPMPDDLAAQIEPLHQAIRALGWPLVMVEGVEADDVIGTLARRAEAAGVACVISTGDKDLAQLVTPHVKLVNTMNNETLDEPGVASKFGVPPGLILDYLTLIGDAVDNVPGVEKVGPKTAVKWLAQYGSLDNVMAHASEIGGVVGENLRKALDWLPKARELLTVKCDVALPVKLEALAARAPDVTALKELFERFDFKTWRRELEEPGALPADRAVTAQADAGAFPSASPVAQLPRSYETILTESQLEAWLARLDAAELVSLDTETTGLDPMQDRLVGISFSVEPHEAAYLPLAHHYAGAPQQLGLDATLARLKPWLEDPTKPKLGQNAKYDRHIFANHGIALAGIAHDTLLQSYVLEAHRSHDMDALADRHLGVKTITYDEVTGKGASRIPFSQVEVARATEYAAEDADITLQLHQCLYPQVREDDKLHFIYRELELPVTDVLYTMERHGVLLDAKLLETQSRELGEKLVELENKAFQAAGQPFNLNSPKQIQEILFDRLKLPVIKKTPGGAPSTDEDVLQQLALDYPLPKLLLEYRGLAKLKSTYTDKLPKMVNPATGRVHTNYAQAVAVTGRLASNDPNLQNIPVRTAEGRRIREAFIAAPGCTLVSADYSQVELRIMAHISRDAGLLNAFAAGEDVHRATAGEIFGVAHDQVTSEQRRYAKVINFGLIYGMSEFGLASQLGIERAAARAYIDRYFARYPGVADYMNRTRESARDKGYVETVFGRRLWLAEIRSSNGARRQAAERAAINAPMQGTAADLIKLAMIAVHRWLNDHKLKSALIMQVHDELVLEVPDAELDLVKTELPRLMGGVAKLEVPLLVDVGVGPDWDKAH